MNGTRQASVQRTGSTGETYAIRWFQPGDAAEVRTLFERGGDGEYSADYFAWQYLEDPYLAHVPVTLAECEGEVVGAQGYRPVRLWTGEGVVLALRPADAAVHPNHRSSGLSIRMARRAIDCYTDGEPSLLFDYASPGALAAQQELGWRSMGAMPVFYRVQRPAAVGGSVFDGRTGRVVGRVADALARGALGAADRVAPSQSGLTVTRHDDVPADTLASLYERSVPDGIHVRREARLYEWWFADPVADHVAYVAEDGDRAVAALVTRTLPGGPVQIREAVPLGPNRSTGALGRLLAAALADNRDAPVVETAGETFPDGLLRRFGFVRDSAPIVTRRTEPLTMAARPLAGESADESLAAAVTDRSAWHPTAPAVDRRR